MDGTIDYMDLLAKAKAGSDFLSAPKFEIGMGAYRRPSPSVAPSYEGGSTVGSGGFSLDPVPQPVQSYGMGGEGGGMRSYVPGQDMANVSGRGEVPETTYELPTAGQAQESAGTDAERQKVEQLANGTIPQLLDALRMMASMEPDAPSNPVFQLDDIYKDSNAMTGIPGTVAQYPTAGGLTRETEY